MPIKLRNELLLLAIEPTYGVFTAPVPATDGIETFERSPELFRGARFAERQVSGGSIATRGPLYGGSLFGMSFSVELKGVGPAAPGVAPQWFTAARACGLEQVITAGVSAGLVPRSTGHESVSGVLYQIDDSGIAVRYRFAGARGEMSISGSGGEVPKITFDLTGRLIEDPTDDVAPPAAASVIYDPSRPPIFHASNMFDWGGYNPVFTEFTLNAGNNVITPTNANSADGYGEIQITSRNPAGSFDPEMTLVATQNWYADMTAQAAKAGQVQLGQVGGQRVTIGWATATYNEMGSGDRDENRVLSPGVKFNESALGNNDEYSILVD